MNQSFRNKLTSLFSSKKGLVSSALAKNQDDELDDIHINPHLSELDEEDEKKELTNPVLLSIKKNIPILISFSLTILSLLFFLIVTHQNFFSAYSFYRTRWFALGIVALSVGVTYLGAFWNNNIQTKLHSYIVFFHSLVLILFSYAYLIRLNGGGLEIFKYNLNTTVVFIPLSILIFLTNYTLLANLKHNQLLSVAQVFFIILFSYSIIGFIDADSTFARNFSQGWLSVIFNWPAWIWLVISSVVITFVTGHDIEHSNNERKTLYLLGYFIVTLEILLAIFIINFSYWYQTLLALISWNFVYTNIYGMMTKKNDTKYKPRLVISIVYHIFLFLVVLYVG